MTTSFTMTASFRHDGREALVENERGERRLHRRMAALMAALPVGVHISEDARCEHVTGNPIGLAMFEARDGENLSAAASDPAAFGRRINLHRTQRLLRSLREHLFSCGYKTTNTAGPSVIG